MGASAEAHLHGAYAVFVQRGSFQRYRRTFVGLVFVWFERAAIEECHLLVEYGCVASRLDVLQGRVDQPQAIVRKARTNSLAARLVPPVLDVPFAELPRGGVQEVMARKSRCRKQQCEHVLELVAETKRAAGLVKGRPAPHAACQGLIRQPAVQHQVK